MTKQNGISTLPVETAFNKATGKVERFQTIRCGQCSGEHRIPMTKERPLPVEMLARHARHAGWDINPSHMKHAKCPDCQPKRKEKMAISKPPQPAQNGRSAEDVIGHLAAVPPREPTKEHKRLIWMAIDESYTEGKGYAAGTTDQSIADGLKVPRAWVTKIREEYFGPDFNEKILAELTVAKGQLADLLEVGKRISEKISDIEKRLGIV